MHCRIFTYRTARRCGGQRSFINPYPIPHGLRGDLWNSLVLHLRFGRCCRHVIRCPVHNASLTRNLTASSGLGLRFERSWSSNIYESVLEGLLFNLHYIFRVREGFGVLKGDRKQLGQLCFTKQGFLITWEMPRGCSHVSLFLRTPS